MNLLLSTTEKKSASICACTATLQNQSSSFPSKQCKTQHLRAVKHIEIISIAIITTTRKVRICRSGGWQQELSPHQTQCCLLSLARRWEHPLHHIHPLAPWLYPVPCASVLALAMVCLFHNRRSHPSSARAQEHIPECACRRAKALLVLATGEHKQHRESPAQGS